MTDAEPATPRPDERLCVRFAATREEVEHYHALSAQRQTGYRESWDGDWIMMYVVAALAVGAGLICAAFRLVDNIYNPTVPLLCGATYYIADPIRNRLVSRYHKQSRAARLAQFIGRDYEIELAASGVTQHSGHYVFAIDWPGIEQVTISREMLFLWTSDSQAIVVPLRAIPDADRSRAVRLARARGAAEPQP